MCIRDRLETVAAGVPGVAGVDRARARWVGHRMEADVLVWVDPSLTIVEGDAIAHDVQSALTSTVAGLDHVEVHACPAHGSSTAARSVVHCDAFGRAPT